ncbi:Glycosyltransferase involved in cell wall bisynthesis [Desulfotomaculum arcticum]|uniref:Glycosyltransferase involved in cell wall bisynthesis n=1 Tax=Desulfotruncus arcticus DSM 17038 TaxID=1121424 RepID=A0A1I2X4L0_9FIRM|nr:glycosyltransferase family 1 protein [Desulfotruncus arcticus]SFH07636.1 Glycosyltransferase involved in cell wall bisynthesis [Desulfotomaculum arcticum] [Desulfotruncus arcticus DSM 17038]
MIRVLHIVSAMNRGGLEAFLMNVYRNIDRAKLQFDFMVHTEEKCAHDAEIHSLGGEIYSVPVRGKGIAANKQALNDFFAAHKEYKIIHQHASSLTYIEPLKAAKKHGVPVRIIHSHNTKQGGSRLHRYIHLVNRLFIKDYATDFFACSDLAAKWMYSVKQYHKGDFKIICNGIEINKFVFNEATRKRVRDEFNIQNKFLVGHVGRFQPQKNHDFLIDIFKAIHEKDNNSVLMLIGEGELRLEILKKVEQLELKDAVIFTGIRSDVIDLLQAMDVFVFPSLHEGLPVALVESQAAGLMCMVSDVITKQVNITELVNNLELSRSADFWAKTIIEKAGNYKRKDTSKLIKDGGFDIKVVAEELLRFYLGKEVTC